MPFRRMRTRRPRRKTRWLAITAGSQSFVANATAYHQLVPIDASGTVPIAEFYGATLVKVILDVSTNMVPFPPDPTLEQHLSWTLNTGLFVAENVVPESTIWQPGLPSGDYMIRETQVGWWNREPETVMAAMAGEAYHNFPHIRLETNVQRKLIENSRLFLALNFAIADDTDLSTIDYGWTGRMLIKLP